MKDDQYLNALRPLPPADRYAKLRELVPPSFKIGDITRLRKRLAEQGVEVPY